MTKSFSLKPYYKIQYLFYEVLGYSEQSNAEENPADD